MKWASACSGRIGTRVDAGGEDWRGHMGSRIVTRGHGFRRRCLRSDRHRGADRLRAGGRAGRGGGAHGGLGLAGSGRQTAMERSAAVVAALVDSEEPVYGVSTGFGSLATVRIPAERREELQRALIRSHAAGMGDPVETRGGTGDDVAARPHPGDGLLRRASRGGGDAAGAAQRRASRPRVPEYGSLGASGDLAPLAHCALALIGRG